MKEGKVDMARRLKVIQYGIGEIGGEITRLLVQKRGVEIVGAYDIDKHKIGRNLEEIVGLDHRLDVKVSNNFDEVFSKKADVVLHSTLSNLEKVYPQLEKVAEVGADIISSCEELSYPYKQHPRLAADLNQLAVKHGITILGTGVNPGFVMDFLPLVMTGACQDIKEIHVKRVINAAQRRRAFQQKIGLGLTPDQFKERIAGGGGHVGLTESITMIADSLGWQLGKINVKIEPIIAKSSMATEFFKAEKGQIIGLKQVARGMIDSKEAISLDFNAYLAPPASFDEIRIIGKPDVTMRIEGGLHGDLATSAIMVNAIPRVMAAEPGLKTMKDLPAPLFIGWDEIHETYKN